MDGDRAFHGRCHTQEKVADVGGETKKMTHIKRLTKLLNTGGE